MKTITKRMFNLMPGTVIYRRNGDTATLTRFDAHHGWYETADGDILTPADLLGDKYDDRDAMPEAEFSMDNGRTRYDADMVEQMCEDELEELSRLWGAVVIMMDEDIREAVHDDIFPCTDQEFLAEYLRRAPRNLVVG